MVDDDDIEAFLEHYGVKGMHWGVVKKEETSGESSVQKALKANPTPKPTAHHKQVQKAHDSHFDKSEGDSPKGWRPTKKQVALIGIGAVATAAIVGGTVYKIKTGKKLPLQKPFPEEFAASDYIKHLGSDKTPGWVHGFAGTHMEPHDYDGLVHNSTARTWLPGHFLSKESFTETPVTYPKGHEFMRLSRAAESSFGAKTYATDGEADFARYVHSFGPGTGPSAHKVLFQAKDEVKIADTKTALDAMHATLKKEGRKNISPKEVIEEYEHLSGGTWETRGAKNFVKELVSRGYHGVVDQMDVGSYGERPLVLLDHSHLTDKVSAPLKTSEIKHLTDILTDIPNRR